MDVNKQEQNRYDVRDRWGRFLGPLSNTRPTAQQAAAVNRAAAAARVTAQRRAREAQRAATVARQHPGSVQAQEAARRAQDVAQGATQDVTNRERQAVMVQERVTLLPQLAKQITGNAATDEQAVNEAFVGVTDARAALRGVKVGDDVDALRDAVLQAEWKHAELNRLAEAYAKARGRERQPTGTVGQGPLTSEVADVSVTGTGVTVALRGTGGTGGTAYSNAEELEAAIRAAMPDAVVTRLSDSTVKVRQRGVPLQTLATRLRAVRLPGRDETGIDYDALAREQDGSASIRGMDERYPLEKAHEVLAEGRWGIVGVRAIGKARALACRASVMMKASGREHLDYSALLTSQIGTHEVVTGGGSLRGNLTALVKTAENVPAEMRVGWYEKAVATLAELRKMVPDADATPEEKRAAQKARAERYGIEALEGQGERLTFAAGDPQSEEEYGDPVNLKYPMGTREQAANARVRFKQFASRYGQDKSRAVVHERIVRAELELGITPSYDANDALDKLLPGDLKDRLSKGAEVGKADNENHEFAENDDEAKSAIYGLVALAAGGEEGAATESELSAYPAVAGDRLAVLQFHYSPPRSSAHLDLRMQLSASEAIGYTLIPKALLPRDLPTLDDAKDFLDEQTIGADESGTPGLPMVPDGAMLALPKGGHDADWIAHEDGEIKAGEPGGFAGRGGMILTARKLFAQWGAQTNDFHEYFLRDAETPAVFGGRFVVRRLNAPNGDGGDPIWSARMAQDLTPYAVSQGAVDAGWMPPPRCVCIPIELMSAVPAEMRYWEMDDPGEARAARDKLVEAKLLTAETIRFHNGAFEVVAEKAKGDWFGAVESYNRLTIVGRVLSVEQINREEKDMHPRYAVQVGVPVGDWKDAAGNRELAQTVDVGGVMHAPVCTVESWQESKPGDLVVLYGAAIAFDRDNDGRYIVSVIGAQVACDVLTGAQPTTLAELTSATSVRIGKEARFAVLKADQDKHYVTGIVLEVTDGSDGTPVAPDTQGDIYDAKTIEQSAHGWMRDHRAFKVVHREGVADGEAVVVESYIAPCEMTVGEAKIKPGTWIMVVEVTGDLWEQVRSGKLNAFSVGGWATEIEV